MTDPFNAEKWSHEWIMSTSDRFSGLAEGNPDTWFAHIQAAYDLGLERGRNVGLEEAAREAYGRSMNVSGGVCFDFDLNYDAPGTMVEGLGEKILNRIKQHIIDPIRALKRETK